MTRDGVRERPTSQTGRRRFTLVGASRVMQGMRRVLVLVVLVIAVAERTIRPELANVGYDEASAASLVAAWRLDGLFPLTGIVSSVSTRSKRCGSARNACNAAVLESNPTGS